MENDGTCFRQLIITRPQGQADDLLDSLNGIINGGQTPSQMSLLHLPLIAIAPLTPCWHPVSPYQGAIFVSANAVNFFSNFAALANCRLYAVGRHTAEKLKKIAQRDVIFPEQMNAEGLAALPDLHHVQGQRWLLVKGQGGRDFLTQSLTARGADVEELDLYQRRLPDISSQQQIIKANQPGSIWLVSSADALGHLFRILGLASKPRHAVKVMVTSQRLNLLARQKGFVVVAEAPGASQQDLVQCVEQWLK